MARLFLVLSDTLAMAVLMGMMDESTPWWYDV
jgi:hypothetical protein